MSDTFDSTIHEEYLFHIGPRPMNFKVLIITGACRSGKTLLAQLIGSMNNVEWIEEPWMPMNIPIMQSYGLIHPNVARDIMRAVTEELFYDRVLLRGANFRPGDLSSIWRVKDPLEIMDRLVNLRTRADVHQYVKEKAPLLLYVLAETNPFIPFLSDTFPGCKIIHVVRNGLDVAASIAEKQWYSDERLKAPHNNILYHPYYSESDAQTYFLPWWVQSGEEETFIKAGEFGKGLYYWQRLLSMNMSQVDEFEMNHKGVYSVVKYEDYVNNPRGILKTLSDSLQITPSQQTNLILHSIHTEELEKKFIHPIKEVSDRELYKTQALLDKLGYNLSIYDLINLRRK